MLTAIVLALAPGALRANTVDYPQADASAADPVRPQPRIVGGTLIQAVDAPYQVYLQGPNWFCGGALLNTTTVITAAHCAVGAVDGVGHLAGGIDITAGRSNFNLVGLGEETSVVASKRIHPSYVTSPIRTSGDIAILTLASPITPNDGSIATIPLPTPWTPTTSPAPVPSALRVSGYGFTDTNAQSSDGALRSVTTTAQLDPEKCGGTSENAIELCAISPVGSSCSGDSGGPLVTAGPDPVLMGIVSNGGDCGPNTIDRYVNLLAPENRLWIDASIAPGSDFHPPLAPRRLSAPTISGPASFRVGDTVTCSAGSFSNTPSEVRIEFTKQDGTVLQSSSGTSATLVLPDSAVGSALACRPYATNAGGTYVGARFLTAATVAAAPAGGSVPTPGPSPTPTPTSATATTPTPAPGSGPATCGKMDALKSADLTVSIVSKPKSARPGRTFSIQVRVSGLPSTPFALEANTYPSKLQSQGFLTLVSTFGAGSTDLTRTLRVKVPKKAKIGSRPTFNVVFWQANSEAELDAASACRTGWNTFKVRIRR